MSPKMVSVPPHSSQNAVSCPRFSDLAFRESVEATKGVKSHDWQLRVPQLPLLVTRWQLIWFYFYTEGGSGEAAAIFVQVSGLNAVKQNINVPFLAFWIDWAPEWTKFSNSVCRTVARSLVSCSRALDELWETEDKHDHWFQHETDSHIITNNHRMQPPSQVWWASHLAVVFAPPLVGVVHHQARQDVQQLHLR